MCEYPGAFMNQRHKRSDRREKIRENNREILVSFEIMKRLSCHTNTHTGTLRRTVSVYSQRLCLLFGANKHKVQRSNLRKSMEENLLRGLSKHTIRLSLTASQCLTTVA